MRQRKLLSILLALALVIGALPATAFAAVGAAIALAATYMKKKAE